MHFLDQNYEEAEKYFRKAVEINPSEPLANGNIGLICMNTGRPQEAEQYYLREIRVNPTYDNVYYNLGLLYYQNNLVGPAIDNWEKTLQVNPEYTSAYDALVNAYTMLGKQEDLDRIRKMAESNGIK
jgi:tetratricopeptide (TPR) repeat protein